MLAEALGVKSVGTVKVIEVALFEVTVQETSLTVITGVPEPNPEPVRVKLSPGYKVVALMAVTLGVEESE